MKTIWQVRRAALARAFGVITLVPRAGRHRGSAQPIGFQPWRSIGAAALAACAIALLSFGTAHATGTTPSTTTAVSSQNPVPVNTPVTLTATVSGNGAGTPTGTVVFNDITIGVPLGSATLSNVGGQQQASITISFKAAETDQIQAFYEGDNTFNTSVGAFSVTITNGNPTTTSAGHRPVRSRLGSQ